MFKYFLYNVLLLSKIPSSLRQFLNYPKHASVLLYNFLD